MTNTQILVIIFGILYFGAILLTRRKGDFEEFSVAGRELGTFLIFSSLCAGYIGPGWTLGLAREGFNNGLYMAMIVPVAGLGLILTAYLFVPVIRKRFSTSQSIGDIVGGPPSHDHRAVKLVTGVVNVLFLAAISIAMSYAGGELINNVFGFPKFWSIVIITAIVTIYSMFGGIRATIQTDAVQFVHFIILIPVLALLIIGADGFNWNDYAQTVRSATTATLEHTDLSTFIEVFSLYFLLAWGLDGGGINRFLSSRSDRTARNAAIYAGLFIAAWLVLMVFIGTLGAYAFPELKDDDQILFHMGYAHFPGIMYGIFIIAMVGVVMSSQDSLLNGASISFAKDIVASLKPDMSDTDKLIYAKGFTIFLGVIAITVAGFMNSVLGIILDISSVYMPVLAPILVFALIKKTHYWPSALWGMAGGLISYLVWNALGSPVIPAIVAGLCGNGIAYLLSDFWFSKQTLNKKVPPLV